MPKQHAKPRLKMTMRGGRMVPVKAYYEGASQKRRMGSKGTALTGPNSNISQSLPVLQARSHHAISNNPYAEGAQQAYISNLVGSGIRPQWNNEEIQALWDRWVVESDKDGGCDFYGLQSLAASAQFESGEVLGRLIYRKPADKLAVPLQLQVIESEHLDPKLSKSDGNRLIKMGIEFNGSGQRSAYHLWQHHPNEPLTTGMNQRIRVPADQMVHMYRRKRPGQIRGIPELSSVIVRLYEIDEMQSATLARQKLAQLFGAFVRRKTGHEPDDEGPYFGELVDNGTEQIEEFVPGGIHYLEDDEEINFSNPPDIGTHYTDWLRSELLAVAKGAGITYEQLTGDLKGVNYSSIRAGVIEFRRRIEALQAQLIVHQWCRPIAAKWLDTAVIAGALKISDYWNRRHEMLAIDWIAPKWQWVDPLKEVSATLMLVRSGFKPRSEAAAELGWSLEQLDKEIARCNESADSHGLIFDSDPRATAKNGSLNAAIEIMNQEEDA